MLADLFEKFESQGYTDEQVLAALIEYFDVY